MKAILEPNEILIRQVPNKKCPDGYYYITERSPESAATFSTVKYTFEEVIQWIYDIFELKPTQKD